MISKELNNSHNTSYNLEKNQKWIDWVVFTICLTLLSPLLNIFLQKLYGVPIVLPSFYTDFCILAIALYIDSIKNFIHPNNFKRKNVPYGLILLTLIILIFDAILYGQLLDVKSSIKVPLTGSTFITMIVIGFVVVGLIIDFISVLKKR